MTAVIDLIRGTSFAYRDEDQLQEGIAAALTAAGHHPQREVRLNARDRLDLLVDRCCIETKLAGTTDRLAAQLRRYATSDLVDELVVVTSRRRHADLPHEIGGKPVTVVRLGGAG